MGSISAVLTVFFAVVIVSHSFRAMALAPNITKLHDAVSHGAVCLDGSPPAYQLDWGVKEGTNNWLLFLQGGYWCSTTEECQQASTDPSGVGSSTKMGNDEFTGILDNKPEFNPYFYNWTRVYIRYCDRSSFTGDKEEAPVGGLYYRGGRIFDYVIDHLLKLGMETASNVLLSGCSAGGVGVILHCDKFRKLLPPKTNVKCLSDSGFILTNVPGTSGLANTFAKVVQLHDSTWHLPSSCTSKMNASLCFYPVNIVPHIQTPIFLLNSGFDTIQIAGINLAPGAPHLCKYALRKECGADQLKKWINYRLTMLQALKDLGNSSTRGLFINSCHTHSQSQFQGKWHGDPDSTLDNTSIANAVGEWFFDIRPFHVIDAHETPRQCVEDDTEPYPCNNFTWGHSYLCKSGNKLID